MPWLPRSARASCRRAAASWETRYIVNVGEGTLFPFAATALVGTFNASNLLASADHVWLGGGFYENGWAVIEPFQYPTKPHVHRLVSTDSPPVAYFGLPMIGFMAHDYVNGSVGLPSVPVLSNYGATSPHRGIRRIE